MREELGSRNVSNKTVDMHSLQRLVYISIKKQYYRVVYILFESREATLSNAPCFVWRRFLYVEIFIKYYTGGKHVNSFVSHCIYPDSSRMGRQLSSHFCPGKVPLCTYCSIHVISFLPRHPAGIYPLECPFHRYIGAL